MWLLIAERALAGKNDVERALELLRECSLLHIEDLLPFFGDFQKIDDFKEVICDALKVSAPADDGKRPVSGLEFS